MQDKKKLEALLLEHRVKSSVRREKLQAIHQFMLSNSRAINDVNFTRISAADLGMLFQATDEYFFDGLATKVCESSALPLTFRLSKRMTTTGGMTTMQRTEAIVGKRSSQFEIAIATTPLFESFNAQTNAKVGGLVCKDRLAALQRIMEHEMVHLVELLVWDDSSCSKAQFRGIANRFFGHTESNHQLLTPRDVAERSFGIAPGMWVTFSNEGQQRRGFVNRITKRATVLVQDKKGTPYSDGKRYVKYYVPLNQLRRAS